MANGRIAIDPALLLNQSTEMTHLTQEFDSLFSSVSNSLSRMNDQWSRNLANNFTPKILSAKGAFSSLTELLRGGAESARTSASLFQSLDLSLEGSGLRSAVGGRAREIWEPTKREIDAFLDNHGLRLPETVGFTGSAKKDYDAFYQDCFDKERMISRKWETGFTTSGSHTEGHLFGDLYWDKTNDVRQLFGSYAVGENFEAVNGQLKQIGQRILVTERTSSLELDLNTLEAHGEAEYNPHQGSAYAKGGIGWNAASVRLSSGEISQDPVVISVGANAGLSAGGDVGIHNGIAKMRGSFAVGGGVEINAEMDYARIWGDVKKAFSRESLKELTTIRL